MKLSTRGRYGVRLMFDLALHYGNGPIYLKDIAERQGISAKYLWQLINPLKSTGLINSTRGAHGGYVLGKEPERISLKEILQVLEGSLCLVDCVDSPSLCERSPSCISREIWGEASKGMQQMLENTTLATMVLRQQEKLQNEAGK
ncbi:MAG: AsnC family transcriptional regulator [Syntrophus sp. (in: bacteria)]|nr:AsnC family transcriptional regulator [Syntrophus sp. (in: bacteria)]